MVIYYVDIEDKMMCPYCKINIKPDFIRNDKEVRIMCPKCKLTIEVKKYARR